MQRVIVGDVNGDQCYFWDVTPRSVTVEGLIGEILSEHPDEWGYITVTNGKPFKLKRREYNKGVLPEDFPQGLLKRKITEVKGRGNWTWFDYDVLVE